MPSLFKKELKPILASIAERAGLPVPWSCGKKPDVSTSVKAYRDYRHLDPFIDHWAETSRITKMLGYYHMFKETPVLHPRYSLLMNTGRTSASKPNIQQCPRNKDFRALFIARPGHQLMTVDFSFIELVTLACICEHRYGRSIMAETIRAGQDPHVYTASMIMDCPYEEVVTGIKLEKIAKKEAEAAALLTGEKPTRTPDLYTNARQSSKAINFGVPGGLGPPKLAAYAKATYGVSITVEEAAIFRHKLTTVIYPELSTYLSDNTLACIASRLNLTVPTICKYFDIDLSDPDSQRTLIGSLRVLKGEPWKKKDETPYKETFIARTWGIFQALAKMTSRLPMIIRMALDKKEPSPVLAAFFQSGSVISLTGRIRAGCNYTQARNTPFQGLAADGAKQALWALSHAGFKPIAFVHDEVLIELLDGPDIKERAEAANIIIQEAMNGVLNHKIKVKTEYSIGPVWTKG